MANFENIFLESKILEPKNRQLQFSKSQNILSKFYEFEIRDLHDFHCYKILHLGFAQIQNFTPIKMV